MSSNYWDVAGAKSFGFKVFWINRAAARTDSLGVAPNAVLTALTDLTAQVRG